MMPPMNSLMTAAVLHGPKDIRIESYRVPELRSGKVLLKTRRVGVCGSDLHYFQHGFCGAFVPSRPFVLGHEFTAEVVAAADDVGTVKAGQRVVVNPARSCGCCGYCRAGRQNLCQRITMLGSASTTPPTDGALAEFVAVYADQCFVLPEQIDDGLGAMIEPFAVALHAIKQAGPISGRQILITGAGTIGSLLATAARAFGAVPVGITDTVESRRKKAEEAGVDAVFNPLLPDMAQRVRNVSGNGFDVIFEASGSPVALRGAFDFVRPGGTIVQIGTIGTAEIPIPVDKILTKEITLVGSMRYGDVFEEAIRLVSSGRVNLAPFIEEVLPFSDCTSALSEANNRAKNLKIQIALDLHSN